MVSGFLDDFARGIAESEKSTSKMQTAPSFARKTVPKNGQNGQFLERFFKKNAVVSGFLDDFGCGIAESEKSTSKMQTAPSFARKTVPKNGQNESNGNRAK